MKFSTIISTVAVLGLIVTGAGFAEANPNMNNNGSGVAMTQLSSEKQSQLGEMREMNFNKMRPVYNELEGKYLELNALSNNANASPEKISQLAQDITKLRGQIQDNRIAFSKDVESKIGIEYSNYGHRDGKGGRGYGKGHRGGMNGGHNGGMNGGHNGGMNDGNGHRGGMMGGHNGGNHNR